MASRLKFCNPDEDSVITNVNDNSSKEGQGKRLACSNCRRRRKKCDLNYPCSSCVKIGLKCNINEEDLRKKRYSSTYVKNLEGHVAYLETKLKELAQKVAPNDENMLKSMMLNDILVDVNFNTGAQNVQSNYPPNPSSVKKEGDPTAKNLVDGKKHDINRPVSTVSNESTGSSNSNTLHHDILRKKKYVKGSIYPEGPTSYKRKKKEIENIFAYKAPRLRIGDLKSTVIVRNQSDSSNGRLNTDPCIIKSLSNFYKYLYPGHFVFVHRESFLYGFFNHNEQTYDDSQYCSEELIYAVAAIGSRLTEDLRHLSEKYYKLAKDKLLKVVFDEHSMAQITTVQALLCLALYELGNGEHQLAWYSSGLAIRVGYDIGFQLDPKVWITEDSTNENQTLSDSELEIRSRIYWGCYIADHFICLLLGRAPSLSVSNSTVPESDELPEIEGTEDFRYESHSVLQVSLPLKNLMILSRIIQIFTSKIFIEPNSTLQRIEYLMKFNLKVYNWRQSLPDFLKWSKTLIQSLDISTDPTISYFWYHYYIVLITFNKPFMEECEESKSVILEVLADLKTLFTNMKIKFDGFEKSTLYHLYSCILSISCFRKLAEMGPDSQVSSTFPNLKHEVKWFRQVLHELSATYDLPNKIEQEDDPDQEQEKLGLQGFQGFHQANNVHDFSLSDEIDDLIKQVFGFDHWNINPTYSL